MIYVGKKTGVGDVMVWLKCCRETYVFLLNGTYVMVEWYRIVKRMCLVLYG